MARPSSYSKKIDDIICQRIADGESVLSIGSDKSMPAKSTIIRWLLANKTIKNDNGEEISVPTHPEFQANYARARLISYQLMADELMDIADDGRNDYMDRLNKNGDEERVVDHEHIQRSRLRCDKRQWFLSKVLPKMYGDNIHVTQDVTHKGTIEHKAADSMNFGQVRDQRQKLRVVGSSETPEK